MKKGILMIALGHEYYYRMATVLAASIRANDDLPICLVTDRTVPANHLLLFDIIKSPSKKSITQKGATEYIKSKLFMYNFSPFEETLFLDVDQVVLVGKKLTDIFEEMKDISFTFSNTGIAGRSEWADIEEVKSIYGDKPFWNFHSELVYFKKSEEVKAYFNEAIKVYEQAAIPSAKRFSGATMADELAFQVAAMITGIYPHKENWTPNFWFKRDEKNNRKRPFELTDYYTYSIGGNALPPAIKNNYNILASHYFAKLGLSGPYQVADKRNYLPERKKI